MMVAPLCGLVLAGGDSRRMGTDKAALELDGVTQLQRAVTQLEQVVDRVYVSVRTADALRTGFDCIPDSVAVRGPAAGILSAHLAYPDHAWLVIACDMPRLDADLLRQLLAARDSAAAATCWLGADGLPEPLCAVYEPATLAAFLQSVRAEGNPSPRDWLGNCGATALQAPDASALRSANTVEEWQELINGYD
ncbi:MAG: NTP transferase domain-containing protein [Gammaproteobacteria bacterium]|nr:NTP transferase domain-containing protein [Gammaproteobacteria bacterium]NND55594.1 NTP transferase domain-containing protein [Gammaproteobacteria bacterium]